MGVETSLRLPPPPPPPPRHPTWFFCFCTPIFPRMQNNSAAENWLSYSLTCSPCCSVSFSLINVGRSDKVPQKRKKENVSTGVRTCVVSLIRCCLSIKQLLIEPRQRSNRLGALPFLIMQVLINQVTSREDCGPQTIKKEAWMFFLRADLCQPALFTFKAN